MRLRWQVVLLMSLPLICLPCRTMTRQLVLLLGSPNAEADAEGDVAAFTSVGSLGANCNGCNDSLDLSADGAGGTVLMKP